MLVRLFALLLATGLIAACGQKGPLRLPGPRPATAVPALPSPAAAGALPAATPRPATAAPEPAKRDTAPDPEP